ncbi:putative G-protein-coupled receptor-like protein [Namao virus]|nr:putative G-protein-coupled receptor-like protein [Namao virus]
MDPLSFIIDDEYDYSGDSGEYDYGNVTEFQSICDMIPPVTEHLFSLCSITILVIGLIFNAVTIHIIYSRLHLKNTINVFLLNICIADILFSTYFMFTSMNITSGWIFGQVLCKLSNAGFYSNTLASILFVTLMVYTLYKKIILKDKWVPQDPINLFLTCVCVWTLCIIMSIPRMYVSKVRLILDKYQCEEHDYDYNWKWFMLWSNFFAAFLVPLILNIYFLWKIYKYVLTHPEFRSMYILLKRYAMSWLVFWMPLRFILIIDWFLDFIDCWHEQTVVAMILIAEVISHLHIIANPIIFAYSSTSFRKHLVEMVMRKKVTLESSESSSSVYRDHLIEMVKLNTDNQ